jgi:hypothetical protein
MRCFGRSCSFQASNFPQSSASTGTNRVCRNASLSATDISLACFSTANSRPIKSTAHVRRFTGHPDPRSLRAIHGLQTRQSDHPAVSSTASNTRTCSGSNPRPTKPTGQQRQQLVFDPHSSASAPTIAVEAPELSVDIRNISDKCVVAIGLSLLYKDSLGKLGPTGYVSILRQQNGQFNCLERGQTDNHIISGDAFDESLRPMTPEVSVDFVIFGDGSTRGPGNNLEQKGYLRGRFDTYKHMQTEKSKKSCGTPLPDKAHLVNRDLSGKATTAFPRASVSAYLTKEAR